MRRSPGASSEPPRHLQRHEGARATPARTFETEVLNDQVRWSPRAASAVNPIIFIPKSLEEDLSSEAFWEVPGAGAATAQLMVLAGLLISW